MNISAGICTFFVRHSAADTVMGILPFPFTRGRRRRVGCALAAFWVRTGLGLVHHHTWRVLGVRGVWVVAVRLVMDGGGILVLSGVGRHSRGNVRALAVSGRARCGRLVEGRGRGGIWTAVHGVGGIHGGGRIGGPSRRGLGGRGPGIRLEGSSEASGGL